MARRKIRKGEMPFASDWNSLLDDVETLKRGSRKGRYAERFCIKNDSGTDLRRGEILGISGLRFSPSENESQFLDEIVLTGSTPDLETHEFKCAVALEPIAAGSIGRCVLDGLARVRLNVIDENDQYAIVDDAQLVLASHWYGNARILAKETEAGSGTGSVTTTGEMWAVVRLNDPSEMKLFGQAGDDGISAGAYGSVTVYLPTGGVFQRSTGEGGANEDVILDVWHPASGVRRIEGGEWLQAEREATQGKWIADAGYCTEDGT